MGSDSAQQPAGPSSSRAPKPFDRRAFLKGFGLVAAAPALGSRLITGNAAAAAAPAASACPDTTRDPARWEASLTAARKMLMVGPDGEDLTLEYLKILIDNGLPKTTHPKKVLIVGAGMAGMAAGILLKQAGHHVTVIEANGNRVGGRIKTFRQHPDFSPKAPFADRSQYAEAGAMRLPDFHPLTLALIDKLGLKRRLFYNVDVAPETGNEGAHVPPVTYTAFNGEVWSRGPVQTAFKAPDQVRGTWIRTNDDQVRRSDYAADPATVSRGFLLPAGEATHTTTELLDQAVDAVRDYFSDRTPSGGRRNKQPLEAWVEGWARVIYDFD